MVLRELAGVLRFDTISGAAVDAAALTAEGLRIELHDGAAQAEQLGLVVDDRFSLVRTAVDTADAAEVVALVDPHEFDTTAGQPPALAQHPAGRQRDVAVPRSRLNCPQVHPRARGAHRRRATPSASTSSPRGGLTPERFGHSREFRPWTNS